MRDPNQMIKIIIAVNVAMYGISLIYNLKGIDFTPHPFSFLLPSFDSLEKLGATGLSPINKHHRYWSLIAASYLHGGILHIFFNMVVFHQLAMIVSREYGLYRMFVVYTLSGVVGYWISYRLKIEWTIGASAAVCGLAGAILYFAKSRGGIYGRALFKQISVWVVFLFLIGMMPGLNINNWGHGGGLFAGIVFGFLLGYQYKRKENLFHKMLAGACALVTIVVLFWAVSTAFLNKLVG